jgi:hypothetical protein
MKQACDISQNWRGKPLRTCLKVHAELNTESAQVKIRRDKFQGDRNYEIQAQIPST